MSVLHGVFYVLLLCHRQALPMSNIVVRKKVIGLVDMWAAGWSPHFQSKRLGTNVVDQHSAKYVKWYMLYGGRLTGSSSILPRR